MSRKKYFGTDGIRGKVGESLINPLFVVKLGWAIGKVLQDGNSKVLIGKDTRISGYMLESALESGLSAAGMNSQLLGPMPTPAIAYLTQTFRASAGIVISASHNLYQDNGIKIFSSNGKKLPDEIEIEIEKQIEKEFKTVPSKSIGKVSRLVDAPGRYIEFCKSTLPTHHRLSGLKIVIDCANGATYHIAPSVFRELGAEVLELGTNPDGYNINDYCGSTNPDVLQKIVLAEKADLGIAFDGDGDRVIMVDHKGEIVDGDELLFIMASNLNGLGKLHGGVVGTGMTNFGVEKAFEKLKIPFLRTHVGDRYVMEALVKNQWELGGESSGHIINLGLTSTGDGIISSLQVLRAMSENGKNLHTLKKDLDKYPQVLINVKSHKKLDISHPTLVSAQESMQKKLGKTGRILLRASGTEPVMRVMVEGENLDIVKQCAQDLAGIVESLK